MVTAQYGKAAYEKGITAPEQDTEFMATLEGQPPHVVAAATNEWHQHWTNAHLEKTVFGSWDWGVAAKNVEGLPQD